MTDINSNWNKTLKFSWAHIIALLALIFYSYISFMGIFYLSKGDLLESVKIIAICDFLLICVFIGSQRIKSVEKKFKRYIIVERFLILLCPVVFLLVLFPYNHFWNVHSQKEELVTLFDQSIEQSKRMFYNYENYANDRIKSFKNANKLDNPNMREAYLKTLNLQLLSDNTTSFINQAVKWIDNAQQGETIWNAFLIGNVKKISKAINEWNNLLVEVSQPILSKERSDIKPFDFDKQSLNAALKKLDNLTALFTKIGGVNFTTVLTGVILFMLLLLPYLLQDRNTKARGLFYLIPPLHGKSSNTNKQEKKPEEVNNDIFNGTI